jgi:hypothetical protein
LEQRRKHLNHLSKLKVLLCSGVKYHQLNLSKRALKLLRVRKDLKLKKTKLRVKNNLKDKLPRRMTQLLKLRVCLIPILSNIRQANDKYIF